MSTIRFQLINDIPSCPSVALQFDDTDAPFIEDILSAFEQFLLAMTYQPASIQKYIDTEAVQKALLERARLVAELKGY